MIRYAIIAAAFFLLGTSVSMVTTTQAHDDNIPWCVPASSSEDPSQTIVWAGTGEIPKEAHEAFKQWLASH